MMALKHDDDPPELLCEIRKSKDVVLKIRLMMNQGMRYVDFRDWLESKDTWGRGYWIDYDREEIIEIASALLDVAERDD